MAKKKVFTPFDTKNFKAFTDSISKRTEELLEDFFVVEKSRTEIKANNHTFAQIKFSNDTDLTMELAVRDDMQTITIRKIINKNSDANLTNCKRNGFKPDSQFSGRSTNWNAWYYRAYDIGMEVDITDDTTVGVAEALYSKVITRQFACFERAVKRADKLQREQEERVAKIQARTRKLSLWVNMHLSEVVDAYNDYLEEKYPELAKTYMVAMLTNVDSPKVTTNLNECARICGVGEAGVVDLYMAFGLVKRSASTSNYLYSSDIPIRIKRRYSTGVDNNEFELKYCETYGSSINASMFGLQGDSSTFSCGIYAPNNLSVAGNPGDNFRYLLERFDKARRLFEKYFTAFADGIREIDNGRYGFSTKPLDIEAAEQ